MHNSQDGNNLTSSAQGNLLSTDCVGCHSTTSNDSIVTLGATQIPIVLNTSGYPTQPLAGGNFYHVSLGGAANHTYGHNVLGIAEEDLNLPEVPGITFKGQPNTITECVNCHSFMTDSFFMHARPGNVLICIDCHIYPKHHADDSATVVDGTGGWYRFLLEVKGIEDPDWEQTVSASDHNEYPGELAVWGGSISDFGCMCHAEFHALRRPGEVGIASPWLRHPVDVALPANGEYSNYTVYNPQAPVARPDLSGYGGPSSTVTPGIDQVACISCHRSHGSEYPDMLRWDYDEMVANAAGAAADTGCFVCHSAKDD